MKALLLLVALANSPPGNTGVSILAPADVAPLLGEVTVVDARERDVFERGHIPGAQRMAWDDWTEEKPGVINFFIGSPRRWGRVPPADERLQARLRALGLSNARTVVVVGTPRAWGEEGRAAWNLLYWGAERVVLLDGGFPAWKAAGLPVETGSPRKLPAGTFTLNVQRQRRAVLDEVVSTATGKGPPRVLLDARTRAEFTGKAVEGQKRGGHVPGARLVEQHALYRADGTYVGAEELLALVGPLGQESAPVTYCTGGVRSALLAMLVEARLGRTAANFDGSMWEYALGPGPVSTDPP